MGDLPKQGSPSRWSSRFWSAAHWEHQLSSDAWEFPCFLGNLTVTLVSPLVSFRGPVRCSIVATLNKSVALFPSATDVV